VGSGSSRKQLSHEILALRNHAWGPRLVVIALDGENPWEHYPEFGDVFLNKLYSRLRELQNQGLIETITPGEFIDRFTSEARALPLREYWYLDIAGRDISNLPLDHYGDAYWSLPRRSVTTYLPEGSWVDGELYIWIGDRQENIAWMWLARARSDIMSSLGVSSFKQLYGEYPEIARYLLRAETSCWWWWYSGYDYDGGGSPESFDPLFKAYLAKAYTLAGLTPPEYLLVSAYPDGRPKGYLNIDSPQSIIQPIIVDASLRMYGLRV